MEESESEWREAIAFAYRSHGKEKREKWLPLREEQEARKGNSPR